MARYGGAAYSEKRDGMISMRSFQEGGAGAGLIGGKGGDFGETVAADNSEGCMAELSRFKVSRVTSEEGSGGR
jgi:hypothetical protein